jgi:hypothetical protein
MRTFSTSKTIPLFTLGILLIFSSCKSTVPFTNDVKKQYNLDEAKLKKMQFYISSEVTLERGQQSSNSQELDAEGKLVVSSSESFDNVVVDAQTPGVCVKVLPGNKLAISFFESDNQFLVFGDPKNSGRYNLMGAEWKNGYGKIKFGGKIYFIQPGGASAYLKFEMKNIEESKTTVTKAKGRTVN